LTSKRSDRSSTTSRESGRDGEMLDLPLGPGDSESGQSPEFDSVGESIDVKDWTQRRKPSRPARRSLDRRKFALALLLFAAAGIGLYFAFWPKPPRVGFSPENFSAGTQGVSLASEPRVITISNVGEREMPIDLLSIVDDPSSEFTIARDACVEHVLQPQQSCNVELVFTPSEMGERRAGLEVHAEMPDSPARLEIVGVGIAPLLEISPASLSFGAQDVGVTSRSKTVTLSNGGTAVLEIHKLEMSGVGSRDFRLRKDECSGKKLVPSASCDLTFSFAPRAAGLRSVDVLVESDALNELPAVKMSGEGVWTGAAFAVDPRSLDFDSHMVGSSGAVERIVVTNRQSAPLRGLQVRLDSAAGAYTLDEESCSGNAIAPGESCSVLVRFAPASEGEFAGLLEIGNPGEGVVGLELSGQGVVPRWVLNLGSIDLGSVRVGSESDPARVELANEGSAAARVNDVVLSGADAKRFRKQRDKCTGQRIEPGRNCVVEITFSAEREGPHRAELRVEPEFGVAPNAVALSAFAAAPRLGVDLELVNFGQVYRTTRKEVVLTASNLGTDSLQVGGFTVEGSSAQSFRLLGGTCFPQATVPPRSRCTLRLGFDPVAEGRATARLLIEHDGLSGPKAIPLAGVGLPPPAPEIFLSTRRLDFGPQPVGERSPILTLTINAAGTGHLRLESFEIEGPDADSFQIVPATCQAAPTLVPGSSCAVGVRMIPSQSGPRRARLVIHHNSASGVSSTDLLGDGLGSGG